MQKRTIFSSLLMVALIVAAMASFASAQSVTVQSKNSLRCSTSSLNVSVSNPSAISALEVVLDYAGAGTVNSVSVNVPGGKLATSGVDLTTPGKIRFYALDLTGGSGCLGSGVNQVVATINYTTNDVCSGTISFTGGSFTCQTSSVTGTTQFVDCATQALVPATVTGGTVTIVNTTPSISCPGDVTMHWGDVLVVNTSASDPDPASCETLTYSLGSGSPAYASINSSNGKITLAPGGAGVCVSTVSAIVTDKCGAADTCSFSVCVQNTPPVATCPADINKIIWGGLATGQVSGTDPDGGPSALVYSVVSFDGPGSVNINPNTGVYTWQTQETPNYISPDTGWTLCVKVSDGANVCSPCSPSNADTCCLSILVIPTARITIEKIHDVIQGGPADVDIYLDGSYENYEIAGFDLLISYDNSAMSLLGVSAGGFVTGNGWEYFTYRFGATGNCSGGCPSGVVRIVALAETNNGPNHPSGYTNVSAGSSVLATLHFLISDDRTLECQYVPVRFWWLDCGDNALSSVSGDTLFISRYIYDLEGNFGDGGAGSIDDGTVGFPTYLGAQDLCIVDPDGEGPKIPPIRIVDFKNGGVDIVCADSIDARGDINLNGISNEIADAVVFTNYFIQGLNAFNINIDGQTAATEINGDGIVLSVADLVYLIRVIVGDALPLPKSAATNAVISSSGKIVSSNVELGAALFVFKGETTVELLAPKMAIKTGMRDGNTYAIVYPDFEHRSTDLSGISAGQIVSANAALLSAEVADLNGTALAVVTKVVPTTYALLQNYPNPFNPTTKIAFDLPVASAYTLTIYNVTGQKVHEVIGTHEAGTVTLEWNAENVATGVYFYKLTAGSFSMTKKMALLK